MRQCRSDQQECSVEPFQKADNARNRCKGSKSTPSRQRAPHRDEGTRTRQKRPVRKPHMKAAARGVGPKVFTEVGVALRYIDETYPIVPVERRIVPDLDRTKRATPVEVDGVFRRLSWLWSHLGCDLQNDKVGVTASHWSPRRGVAGSAAGSFCASSEAVRPGRRCLRLHERHARCAPSALRRV